MVVGRKHQKQTTSSGRRAPEVAVWTRDIYKHRGHNSFVIYKYTAVLQVFKFHKKEAGRERDQKNPPTNRTKRKNKNIEKNKNKPRLTTQLYRSKDNRELTCSHTVVVCTSITEVTTQERGPREQARPHPRPRTREIAHTRTAMHAQPHTPPLARTSTRTDTPAGQQAEGRRVSPVRVLLYVIIRGGTIKEAGVEGLPLLPSGEDT